MILTIIIVLGSLIGLVTLHEFGHFIAAKKFGVRVDEFGIGYPPRIFGKKIRGTLYSLNLLPFGAFVRMPGEVENSEDPDSFSKKPLWQRATIVVAGVVSFWIIAAVLFTIVMATGVPTAISDQELVSDPKVQISAISSDSPAELADIKIGDVIKSAKDGNQEISITKISELQDFINANKGQDVVLVISRGQELIEKNVAVRTEVPEGEGPLGVALVRVAIKSFPWWQAPWEGVKTTFNLTVGVVEGYVQAITNISKGVPSGVNLVGPVGIVSLFAQFSELGVNYFIQFVAMIAIYIAVFNILPIPALDGGKLLFLGIEAIRKKPVNQKIEQNVTVVFFGLLILMMVWVTIKDVINLF